jgi:catechol 2,3-dioxygenase-like lactoylglutathione lyase family enzyme
VSDFNKAVRFYWEVFGCPLVGVADTPAERVRSFFRVNGEAPACKIGWIRVPGGGVLEIFEFTPQRPSVPGPWNQVGLTHVSFNVRNLERWHEFLVTRGLMPRRPSDLRAGIRSSRVRRQPDRADGLGHTTRCSGSARSVAGSDAGWRHTRVRDVLAVTMAQRTIHQAWFLIVLGAVTAFWVATLDFVRPVFWAAVLAIILPWHRRIEALVGGRKGPAAVLTTSVIILAVFIPLSVTGVAVSREAITLYARITSGEIDLPGLLQRLNPTARDLAVRVGIDPASIEKSVSDAAGSAAQLIPGPWSSVRTRQHGGADRADALSLFFFLRDSNRFRGQLTPFRSASRQRHVCKAHNCRAAQRHPARRRRAGALGISSGSSAFAPRHSGASS